MSGITSLEIELAVVAVFNKRRRLIVPNVSWGFGFSYEADLVAVSRDGYLEEIEIKISAADLAADRKKNKWTKGLDRRVKRIWFALPEDIAIKHADLVPSIAGIFHCVRNRVGEVVAKIQRRAEILYPRKLTPEEMLKLAHLGAMRIWNLKKGIARLKGVTKCQSLTK